MFYSVSIRIKGSSSVLEHGECTCNEINFWRTKAIRAAKMNQCQVLLELKPREQIFEYGPPQEIKPSPEKIGSRNQVMQVDMTDCETG